MFGFHDKDLLEKWWYDDYVGVVHSGGKKCYRASCTLLFGRSLTRWCKVVEIVLEVLFWPLEKCLWASELEWCTHEEQSGRCSDLSYSASRSDVWSKRHVNVLHQGVNEAHLDV